MKICLTSYDAPDIPQWVFDRLSEHGCSLACSPVEHAEGLPQAVIDADAVWVYGGGREITGEVVRELKNCRLILRSGTGTDNVAVETATERGILVANTPEASTDTVAEHAIALMLDVLRRVTELDREVRAGRWNRDSGKYPVHTLTGRTLGLLGFGRIARAVAKKLSGFDMKILVHDPGVDDEQISKLGCEPVSLQALFESSDVLSLHCPLLSDSHHIVGACELALMKPTAVLVNTARGKLIDEKAFIAALQEGKIAGAGLDVLEQQPPEDDNPLIAMDNVVINPHMAGYDEGLRYRFWEQSVRTLIATQESGRPIWIVNPEVLESA